MEENEILEEYMMMIHRIANSFDEFTTIEELEEIIHEIENVMMEAESDDDISHEDYEELGELADRIVNEFYDELFHLKKKNMKESRKIIRLTESDLKRLVKRVIKEQQQIVANPSNIQDILKQIPNAKDVLKSCADELRLDLIRAFLTPETPMAGMTAVFKMMHPGGANPKEKLEKEIKQITACVTQKSPDLAKLLGTSVRF